MAPVLTISSFYYSTNMLKAQQFKKHMQVNCLQYLLKRSIWRLNSLTWDNACRTFMRCLRLFLWIHAILNYWSLILLSWRRTYVL